MPERSLLRRLRRRLSDRPDREHEMTINRIVIVSVFVAYIILADRFGVPGAYETMLRTLPLFGAYYVASLLLFAHLIWKPDVSMGRRVVAMFVDLGIFSWGMHIWGENGVLGYPVFLWVIFGNGFRFGVKYLFMSMAIGLTGFSLVLLTTPFWQSHPVLGVSLLVGMFLLPAYVSVLIRRLSAAIQQAEEANKAKSLFLAAVSHELRTPLNAIIALSDLLQRSRLDADQRDMAQTVNMSGRALLDLINTILDLSRIEAGAAPKPLGPVDLYALIDQQRRLMKTAATAKGLSLGVRIATGTPRHVISSDQVIRETLVNLLGNAIKFTAKGGVLISVGMDHDEDGLPRLLIAVADTGIGIAENARQRIFQSFTQADETILDRFGGTGLGLSIVKQMIEAQGGSVQVDSVVGEGSTFTLSIPVTLPEAAAMPAPDASVRRPAVLIVARDGVLAEAFRSVGALPEVVPTLAIARERALLSMAGDGPRAVVAADLEAVPAAELEQFARQIGAAPELRQPILALRATEGELPALPVDVLVELAPEPDPVQLEALTRSISRGLQSGEDPALKVRPMSILVAEDNRTNQKVIRKLLETNGHRVEIAETGDAAVAALLENSFDLVLMDINMPGMNGIEATKLYRFSTLGRARTPIIALTADATPETRARCIEAGMDDCLHKPIERDDLFRLLGSYAGTESADAAPAAEATPAALLAPAETATDAEAGNAPRPILDTQVLARLFALGGPAFVGDLIDQFMNDARQTLTAIEETVARHDVQGFREQLHALRSGAANVGAMQLFDLCLAWRDTTDAELVQQGPQRLALLEDALRELPPALAMALADSRVFPETTVPPEFGSRNVA